MWKGHIEGKTQISNLGGRQKVHMRQEIENDQVGAWEGITMTCLAVLTGWWG